MKRVEPLNWSVIHAQLTGMEIGLAVAKLGDILVNKVNEIVEEYNSEINTKQD